MEIIFFLAFLLLGFFMGRDSMKDELAAGVAPEKVNVSKEAVFTAQIEIYYDRKCKVDEIKLVPDTTTLKTI